MKLVTFRHDGHVVSGVVDPAREVVVPFSEEAGLPPDVTGVIALGDAGLARLSGILDRPGIPLRDVRLLAPLRPRNNVMCVGKNYADHAREFSASGFDASQQQAVPDHPVVFTKALSSLAGPDDEVDVSADPTGTSDYEGELGVVIGRGGRGIAAADAWDHVFGYVVVNDLTVRALQKQHVQFFIGKSARTYCPMGPWVVTRDEVRDIGSSWVRTLVDGEERQAAPVSDLIFPVPRLIEAISAVVLLEPGDVIATGTPAGVGIGFEPPRYLRPGQTVTVSVDGVGSLTNRTV